MAGEELFLASDHAGLDLKQSLAEFLEDQGYTVEDMGPEEYEAEDDYPDLIIPAVEKAVENDAKAVVLGHSGQGEAIAANKVEGARAAVLYSGNTEIVKLSRDHNDANVLSLGAGFMEEEEAREAVKQWIETDFSEAARHRRRIRKLHGYESRTRQVIPAIIASDQEELEIRFSKIGDVSSYFHLDVEDGDFVSRRSLNFDFSLPEDKRYEAHLMVESPLDWLDSHRGLVECAIFHYESRVNVGKAIKKLERRDLEAGLAVNPGTPLTEVEGFLDDIDKLQVMTVNPGKYGAGFVEETVEKVVRAREARPALDIQVDGHVTPQTIGKLLDAGANRFVSGSYIMNADDSEEALETLRQAVGQ